MSIAIRIQPLKDLLKGHQLALVNHLLRVHIRVNRVRVLVLLDVTLDYGCHLAVVAHHAGFVEVITDCGSTFRPFLLHRGPSNLRLEQSLARVGVV